MARRYTLEDIRDFIEGEEGNGCKLISNFYENNTTKLTIECSCGNEFITNFSTFKSRKKKQCNECTIKNRPYNPMSYEEIKEYVEVASNSGCKLLSTDYKYLSDKLLFLCSCGEEFETTFYEFKKFNKHKCFKCSQKAKGLKHRHSYEYVKSFIEEESDSGCKLLSTEYVGVNELLKIQCKCGEVFEATYHKFRDNYKRQCNRCGKKESQGEKKIKKYLKSIKVNFKIEYTFDDCRVTHPLRFDFVVFDENYEIKYLIEFDGIQHFQPTRFGSMTEEDSIIAFERTKLYDQIKNEYCERSGINLIRIPYWDFKNINIILQDLFNKNYN